MGLEYSSTRSKPQELMEVSGQLHVPADTPVPIGQEAGWAPEPAWLRRRREKSSAGNQTPVV
jgi:hypothetical protein